MVKDQDKKLAEYWKKFQTELGRGNGALGLMSHLNKATMREAC